MITPTFTVSFTVAEDRRSGSVRVTSNPVDYTGQGVALADVEIAVAISGPTGSAIRVIGFGVGGNIHPAVQAWEEYPLPLDLTGASVQSGTYTVSIVARVSGGVQPGDYEPDPQAVDLCLDCIPAPCIEVYADCLRAQVTATDATVWGAGWTVSRLMTLKYPGSFPHSDITSTTTVVSTGSEPIPAKGTWTALLAVTATKGPLTVSLTFTKEFVGDCELTACEIACLVKKAYDRFVAAKQAGQDTSREWSDVVTVSVYQELIMAQVRCGKDGAYISEYARQLKATLNISGDCSCGDCDGDLVQPLLPVTQLPSYTAGYGIDITGDVISINTTVQNILNSFRLEEVVSTDGTVTVTATTPSPGVRQFDLSVTNQVEDYIEFVWEVNTNSGTPLYSLANVVNVGTFFQSPTITENVGSKSYIVTDFLTNPVDSAFTVSINMEGRALTPFMTVADRYASIMDVRIFNGQWINPPGGTQNFSFALLPIGPNLGNMLGSAQIASWYTAFLTNFAVRVKITKA